VSDVLAAGVLASAASPSDTLLQRWAAAMLASACLYSAGMAWNDAADAPRDRVERPERPIPSGRVTRRFAIALGAALAGIGLLAAAIGGRGPLLCAVALALAILAYDLRLSGRRAIGPLGMAVCRGLNLLMGLLVFGPPAAAGWWAAALLALYVFGVTHLSLGETGGGARAAVGVACALAISAGLGVGLLGVWAGGARSPWQVAALVAPLTMLAVRAGPPLRRAWRQPRPQCIGPAVGALVSGILWFDAAVAMGAGAPRWLIPFLGLAAIQAWLRRSFRVT
jgi:4-hydroxybenzoate polyprenyltransferase